MIRRTELQEKAREWALREETVEKDYVISWVLWGIATSPALSTGWAFKGGTCLKKCYIETYRFSEDIDFTVLPDGLATHEDIESALAEMLERVQQESGIDVTSRQPRLRQRAGGRSLEGRIYYRGPRGAPQHASIKLDITLDEKVVRPTVLRPIAHPYSDQPNPPAPVRCYGFDELFAEKIRAMGERSRPRDLYDIVNLYRRTDLRAHPDAIRTALVEKCESKGVDMPSAESVLASPHRPELEAEWRNMLAHQLPRLPPIGSFLDEIPRLFDWLEGKEAVAALPSLPETPGAVTDWAPPPTVWAWGEAIPIEPLRFAAANHLCVELDYNGRTRLVEPYALRRTRAGRLLLMAVRPDTREIRSYRVDRMEGLRVTDRPFTPTYPIEFSARGQVYAPPVERRSAGRRPTSGPVYIVECLSCGRQFRRKRRNTVMRPHKDRYGLRCPGRRGYVADRID